MTGKHSGVAKLWLLNLLGNAALLAAVYYWLLLPDAHGWQVAGSAILAVLIIFCGLWLRTGSFAYFRLAEFREKSEVWRAFRYSLHHLIALALWAIPFFATEWWLLRLRRYTPQFGVWLWQKAPALRFGSPRALYHTSNWVLLIAMALIAALWLPAATTVAARGLSNSLVRSWRLLKQGAYWLWIIVLALIGGYLPYKLIWWIPDLSTLQKQAWSAGLRFFFAYLFMISAWVALMLVIGERVEGCDSSPPGQP